MVVVVFVLYFLEFIVFNKIVYVFDKSILDVFLVRWFFFVFFFEIYGGVVGFYDYGFIGFVF